MKRFLAFLFSVLISLPVFISCDKENPDEPDNTNPSSLPGVLVLVEDIHYNDLSSKLAQYQRDVALQGWKAIIHQWTGTSIDDLRDVVKDRIETDSIHGLFIIGNLPVAWYEMSDWGDYEDFPTDHYLMDPYSLWYDNDFNGIYDDHENIDLKIFVSRLDGSSNELRNYFDKAHTYRTTGSLVTNRGFLFIDDDWESLYQDEFFGTDYLYPGIDRYVDQSMTNKSKYISYLTASGAEYVHQMIHSYPNELAIDNYGNIEYFNCSDIESNNIKASFFNLFNCSASRFTEENLATAYLLRTNYGLATMGTTKVGGNYFPDQFNSDLADGKTWGQAFISWYNLSGISMTDKWTLGMCIQGDPMLRLYPATKKSIPSPKLPDLGQLEKMAREDVTIFKPRKHFSDYKAENPVFFER